jgi:hypothetical protein
MSVSGRADNTVAGVRSHQDMKGRGHVGNLPRKKVVQGKNLMTVCQGRFALFDDASFTTAVHKAKHIPTARPASGSDAGKVGTVSREMPRDAGFVNRHTDWSLEFRTLASRLTGSCHSVDVLPDRQLDTRFWGKGAAKANTI